MIRLPTFRALLLGGVLLCALVLAPRPVSAHEGEGVLTLEATHPAGDLAVHYVVRLTWENDGHPAADATVTATALDTAGEPQTPVSLRQTNDDGRYEGAITFPSAGTWTVRLTSVTPAGTLETTTEVAPPTTEPPPADGTTVSSADEPPATTGADSPQTEAASAESEASDGNGWLLPAIVAVVFVVLAVGAVLALRARRSVS
jgi:cobalamin biosynthesis Mg chelatase CobN